VPRAKTARYIGFTNLATQEHPGRQIIAGITKAAGTAT